ncbi:MAG: cytochrome d ubiquinol oxidase subunit II [Prevotellaceae bacterium]|jgi:cytochrome d ubiquinol oxidase subunit II|nr:cytochrome d ubiquinol oxidase subunit II [Prevotellaceae bacterium]
MSIIFYQHYWWFLVSLLGALLVFLLFVQGGQSLIYQIGKKESEFQLLLNSLSKKWEITFTTLVTFGGAFFASFPLFYSTSFGGAYWVWMLILFSFIIQAVSFEFIHKKGNLLGNGMYKCFLFINGLLAPILIGAAVSTFFFGAEFVVNKGNIVGEVGNSTISQWTTSWHGLEAVWGGTTSFHLWNVVLGLAVFFLVRCLGALYFINNVNNAEIATRSRKQVLINAIAFLVFFLPYLVKLLLKDGWTEQADGSIIAEQPYKYLHTLLSDWWLIAVLLIGVAGVLYGFVCGALCKTSRKGIWFAGIGTVLTVLAVLLVAGFNNSAYYPSLSDTNSSLTIKNSSSSLFTLKTMSIVSLLVPFVLAYIWAVWRKMDKK